MAKKLFVDLEECTGCNLCVETCPDVFDLNDDGLAVITDPNGASDDEIQQCIDDCPVTCIEWKDM